MSDEEKWWIERRDLGDGREAYVYPLTFGRARLSIGRVGAHVFLDGW